jgi:hypothetical protein
VPGSANRKARARERPAWRSSLTVRVSPPGGAAAFKLTVGPRELTDLTKTVGDSYRVSVSAKTRTRTRRRLMCLWGAGGVGCTVGCSLQAAIGVIAQQTATDCSGIPVP